MLAEMMNTAEGQSLAKRDRGRKAGELPHADVALRRFGHHWPRPAADAAEDADPSPRVRLYRDSAAWCHYCQRVWLMLEAKEVDYVVEKVDLQSYGERPASFAERVPQGRVPAAEIDGEVVSDSLEIMFTLDRTFLDPDRPLFPPEGLERKRATILLELERAVHAAWCNYLLRPERPFQKRDANDFDAALRQVEAELAVNPQTDWFLSYNYPTIVDFQFVTLIERVVATAHYYKGVDVRELYPGLGPWLDAFERLPYYMATKGDYYTHCMAIEPQYGKVYENKNVAATRVRMCVSPKQARLPVDPDLEFEEQWTDRELRTPIEAHSIEAAWELVRNHGALARYGCRAIGGDVGAWSQGDPYRSPLADPGAATNESLAEAVDVLLLAIATALFRQNPELAKGQAREAVAAAGPGSRVGFVVAACLEYILLRIGVPRDMSMPAAKCLRAYLSEVSLDLR